MPVEQDTPARAADQHFSLRTAQWRYIRCRNGEEELYDHAADPHEWKNLADDPEALPVLEAMREKLRQAVEM